MIFLQIRRNNPGSTGCRKCQQNKLRLKISLVESLFYLLVKRAEKLLDKVLTTFLFVLGNLTFDTTENDLKTFFEDTSNSLLWKFFYPFF